MTETKLSGRMTDVTPDLAAKWLEGKTHNRLIRQSKVNEYAADMKAGRWMETHQGIAFDEDDKLIDGQHRLWAVIEADVPVRLMVTRGVSSEAMIAIDGGIPRGIADVIRIQDPESGVGTIHVAVARAMMSGFSQTMKSVPRQEIKAFIDRHWDAIVFTCDAFGTRKKAGLTVAQVMAPIGRAYYTQDRERLKEFAASLMTGMTNGSESDSIVVRLRNWLLDVRQGVRVAGKANVRTTLLFYGKSERALKAYLRGEKLNTLYPATEELFPLPEEQTQPRGRRRRA